MSEDQRVSRNPAEPAKDARAGAERWADYLDWVRGDLIAGVCALDEAAQRTSLVPSGWTPLELLNHCLHMEQRWFVWGFLGEQVEQPWGDWSRGEPWGAEDSNETESDARWMVQAGVTADLLADQLAALGERTREVLVNHSLSAVAASGGRFADDPPDLEWICFHVLAEYARHAGHLDIVVELSRG